MSQNDSLLVLDPTRIAIPPDICTYLTTLLHQTLAGTMEPQSQAVQASCEAQVNDSFLLQTVFAATTAALDAYTDLVVAHLSVLGRGDWPRPPGPLVRSVPRSVVRTKVPSRRSFGGTSMTPQAYRNATRSA